MSHPYANSLAGYLVCYKNPYATYQCLQSFRAWYPATTLVVASDNGYDYENMAAHFGAVYIHETESVNCSFSQCDVERRKEIIRQLLRRHARALEAVTEPYLMWLEDDVRVNSPVTATLQSDMNGFNPNQLPHDTRQAFIQTFHLPDHGSLTRTGHGGTIYKTQHLRDSLANLEMHERVLRFYEHTPLEWCMDTFLSLLICATHGSISSYEGHGDGHEAVDPSLVVQHQFKRYYNQPLPVELAHLCSEQSCSDPSEHKCA
jgi:hypothetical protein